MEILFYIFGIFYLVAVSHFNIGMYIYFDTSGIYVWAVNSIYAFLFLPCLFFDVPDRFMKFGLTFQESMVMVMALFFLGSVLGVFVAWILGLNDRYGDETIN